MHERTLRETCNDFCMARQRSRATAFHAKSAVNLAGRHLGNNSVTLTELGESNLQLLEMGRLNCLAGCQRTSSTTRSSMKMACEPPVLSAANLVENQTFGTGLGDRLLGRCLVRLLDHQSRLGNCQTFPKTLNLTLRGCDGVNRTLGLLLQLPALRDGCMPPTLAS